MQNNTPSADRRTNFTTGRPRMILAGTPKHTEVHPAIHGRTESHRRTHIHASARTRTEAPDTPQPRARARTTNTPETRRQSHEETQRKPPRGGKICKGRQRRRHRKKNKHSHNSDTHVGHKVRNADGRGGGLETDRQTGVRRRPSTDARRSRQTQIRPCIGTQMQTQTEAHAQRPTFRDRGSKQTYQTFIVPPHHKHTRDACRGTRVHRETATGTFRRRNHRHFDANTATDTHRCLQIQRPTQRQAHH